MRVGCYQFAPVFGDVAANIENVQDTLVAIDADLMVLPELFSTGYQFLSKSEVLELSEEVPGGAACRALTEIAAAKGMHIVAGLAERVGDRCYNSAVLIGPNGVIGTYRKTHLFFEETVWFAPGDTGFRVLDIGPERSRIRLGLMVCFDWYFPESARTLALKGADILCHPSNLVTPHCPDAMITRCLENRVFSITCNRTGYEERGGKPRLTFIGQSRIVSPRGEVLVSASPTADELSIVEIDSTLARDKRLNAYNDLFVARRPVMYELDAQEGAQGSPVCTSFGYTSKALDLEVPVHSATAQVAMNGDPTSSLVGQKRIGVFVIAYNAESHIAETLRRIPEDIWEVIDTVYVIDDCSTDDTVERALAFQEHRGKLVVLRNRMNRMYGGNQKLGYQYAIDQGLDAVVMLHADGQYAPEYLGKMLAPIIYGDADVVIGSRMLRWSDALQGRMPTYKFIGNIILTKIQNWLSDMHLSEFHSGYRAYSTRFLRRIPFWEYTDNWHFDTEILLGAKYSGARLQEIAIPTYYGAEICRVNGMAYAMHCILTSVRYYLFRKQLLYTRAFDMAQPDGKKYVSKFQDPFSSHSKIFDRLNIEPLIGKKVLDLGVGDASLIGRIAAMGVTVDAIEQDATACEMAERVCRRVYRADIEKIDDIKLDELYDVVIMADVLEHLRNPEDVLSQAKTYLKPGGLLVVSLPNVANIYVRLNLLFGRFPYHTKGILDQTHLRFYTLKTAERLLTKTGWVIVGKDVTIIPCQAVFPFLANKPWYVLMRLLYGVTKAWKGLFAYQGLFYCRNPNKPVLL